FRLSKSVIGIDIRIEMENHQVIQISNYDNNGKNDMDALWKINALPGWNEYWLSVANLYFLERSKAVNKNELWALPNGKIKSIEIKMNNIEDGDFLEFDWLKLFRACPDAISPDNSFVIGGRITDDYGPVKNIAVTIKTA